MNDAQPCVPNVLFCDTCREGNLPCKPFRSLKELDQHKRIEHNVVSVILRYIFMIVICVLPVRCSSLVVPESSFTRVRHGMGAKSALFVVAMLYSQALLV